MQRSIPYLLLVSLTWSAGSLAQAVDARAALRAAVAAMGTDDVRTVEYSGAGFSSRIGQQFAVDGGWPTYEVADYTRHIDYGAGWSREDYTRRQGRYPTFGRVPMADQRIMRILPRGYGRNRESIWKRGCQVLA